MNDKKMQILKAAVRLFGERDYHTTSVQDIVSLVGVSKGAFYQHYSSKEELLISIFQYYMDSIRNRLQETEDDAGLSARDKLLKSIELQISLVVEDEDFLSLHMKGTAFLVQGVKELLVEQSVYTIRWVEKHIAELYGSAIEPHAYDCANMLNGMLKEYLFHYILYQAPLNPPELASYLLNRLDDIAEGLMREQPKPLVSAGFMLHRIFAADCAQSSQTHIRTVKEWFCSLALPPESASAIQQALEAVIEETGKELPNPVIIRGMHSYLATLTRELPGAAAKLDALFACIQKEA